MKTRAKSNAFKFNKLCSINSINTRVRDKSNLLCRLPHVAQVGEIAISLLSQLCSKGMIPYPELANQPFSRSRFHSSENALSKP